MVAKKIKAVFLCHTFKVNILIFFIVPFLLCIILTPADAQTSIDNFAFTTENYSYDSDMNSIIASTFGSEYRLADWNDLVNYYQGGGDMNQLTNLLDSSEKWVSRNGIEFYSSNRHYFMSVHYGSVPAGWLVHDTIDSNLIDLGSWYNSRPILAYTDTPPVVPEPISSLLFIVGGATLGIRRFSKKINIKR